jgi:hypothetical protein
MKLEFRLGVFAVLLLLPWGISVDASTCGVPGADGQTELEKAFYASGELRSTEEKMVSIEPTRGGAREVKIRSVILQRGERKTKGAFVLVRLPPTACTYFVDEAELKSAAVVLPQLLAFTHSARPATEGTSSKLRYRFRDGFTLTAEAGKPNELRLDASGDFTVLEPPADAKTFVDALIKIANSFQSSGAKTAK